MQETLVTLVLRVQEDLLDLPDQQDQQEKMDHLGPQVPLVNPDQEVLRVKEDQMAPQVNLVLQENVDLQGHQALLGLLESEGQEDPADQLVKEEALAPQVKALTIYVYM